MNTPVPVDPVGSAPALGNLYTMFWSLLNIVMLIGIVVLIFWYLKNRHNYQKQLLSKMDSLISLLQQKNTDDK
jgi:uncharacterized membrane-anchored protein YhcB (DUF1043 family)